MTTQHQTNLSIRRAIRRRCSGQTLVLAAVFLIALMGILGLIGDGGMVAANRRHAQRAADAAAQAGAVEFLKGFSAIEQDSARAGALEVALMNGTDSADHVVVEIPPMAGSGSAYGGSNGFIRVEVTRPVELGLMNLLLQLNVVNVRASATAGMVRVPYDDASILILSPNNSSALTLVGNASINVGAGTVWVNSSDMGAIMMGNGTSITAATVVVVGGVNGGQGQTQIHGTQIEGAQAKAADDPFQFLPAPRLSDYVTSPDSAGTASNPATKAVNGVCTLNPGIYWGGLSLTGHATVHFLPGRYILAGGGFKLAGQAKADGTDVFFYNTQDPNNPNGAGAMAAFDIAGQGDMGIKAPTAAADSTYKGIVVFNDRASTSDVRVVGNGVGNGTPYAGYIYNKSGAVILSGNGSLVGLGVVANTMQLNGNAVFSGAIERARTPDTTIVRLVE